MFVEGRNAAFEIGGKRGARFWRAEEIGKSSERGDDGLNGMWIGGVGRDSDFLESFHGFEAVEILSHQHKIGVQSGDSFETRIDGTADLGFLFRLGRKI